MARSIWNGAISFGMVSIPVKLFPATSDKDIALNELHAKCHSKMQRKRWCPTCDAEVPNDEVVKGYPYAKSQYVELTEDDFEKIPLPSKHTITVTSFVKASQIDPVFFDKAYTLEPDEVGLKPFWLFMYALQEKGVAAVAKIAIRKKEQLCLLRASGPVLMLETLYYADEVRVELDKALAEVPLSDPEKTMALALVDMMAADFKAEEYRDTYRDALMEVIQAKLEGKEIVAAPEAPVQVMDLMEALRLSVEQVKRSKEAS